MQRLVMGSILAALLWAIGLVIFVKQLPAATQLASTNYDGIVVYTGGADRIATGMDLLAKGAGDRLLISGVHPETSRTRLSEMWPGAQEKFECCVDLGRQALSTEGNAVELSNWALERNFDRIILVTSDYHMPRAVAATKTRMPEADITPFVVASGYLDASGRPASLDAWRKLSGEYTKYFLSQIKAFLSSFGR